MGHLIVVIGGIIPLVIGLWWLFDPELEANDSPFVGRVKGGLMVAAGLIFFVIIYAFKAW